MSRRAFAVVAAGFCTLFIAFGIRYSYGLILPYMLESLHISKTGAGVIFSSYFITATAFSPIFGFLSDRFDTRIILTGFVAILGLGSLLMTTATSVLQASIFFAIAGIGHSACWAPVVAVVMRWVRPCQRGMMISIVDLGTTAGIALWSLLIPIIMLWGNWQSVWGVLGGTGLVIAVLNFVLIRSHPLPQQGNRAGESVPGVRLDLRQTLRIILRDGKFYLIGISYLLISFSILIPFTFMVSFATQNLNIPYSAATSLLVVIAVSGAIGKLVLAYISDRTGRIKIMMLCGLLTAVGALIMAYAEGLMPLMIATVFFGIGYGSLWAVYAASARDFFSSDCAGSIIGLWTVFHGVGSVFAPVISGWLIDRTGAYFWSFILAAASSLLASISLGPLLPVEKTELWQEKSAVERKV